MLETAFEPIEDIQMMTNHSNLCVVRTAKLLPTLNFMQNAWWRLQELIPDDTDWQEFNILIYQRLTTNEN